MQRQSVRARVNAGAALLIAVAISATACARQESDPGNRSDATKETAPAPVPAAPASAPPPSLLFPGDEAPAALLGSARDWRRDGGAGNRVLVLTFSTTKCAAGDPCEQIEQKFRDIQQSVQADTQMRGSVGLVTLSVDPASDVPAARRVHAERIGADPSLWRFGALAPDQIAGVKARVGLIPSGSTGVADERDNQVTLVVDDAGRVAKVYRGGAWVPDDVLQDLRGLLTPVDPALIAAYVAGQEALAADNIAGARAALARLARARSADRRVARLASEAASSSELAAMRTAFKPLSLAMLKPQLPPDYQVVYCQMFEENAGAYWIQKVGPIANPYYGRSMLRCGIDQSAGAHVDHSPRFGGLLMMAEDGFHHVEATYAKDGVVRVRVSDNFKEPMRVSPFVGRVVLKEEYDQARHEFREIEMFRLAPSRDGMMLLARIGARSYPADITVKLAFERGVDEERFDFIFATPSNDPVAPNASTQK